MNRSQFMTNTQIAKWRLAESQAGCKLPRTHENCNRILGVSRPGKTAKDKRRGVQPLFLKLLCLGRWVRGNPLQGICLMCSIHIQGTKFQKSFAAAVNDRWGRLLERVHAFASKRSSKRTERRDEFMRVLCKQVQQSGFHPDPKGVGFDSLYPLQFMATWQNG